MQQLSDASQGKVTVLIAKQAKVSASSINQSEAKNSNDYESDNYSRHAFRLDGRRRAGKDTEI